MFKALIMRFIYNLTSTIQCALPTHSELKKNFSLKACFFNRLNLANAQLIFESALLTS